MPVISICENCGKEIKHKPSKSPKYCSKECKGLAQRGKKPYKIEFDMDEIKRLYVEEKMSASEIAEVMGTYKKMILTRLRDMGVERRSTGKGKSLYMIKNPDQNPNNMPGVKEKQSKAQLLYNKLHREDVVKRNQKIKESWSSDELREKHSKKVSKTLLNRTSQQKYETMVKQFDTKRRNGTLNCSGVEDKVEKMLISEGIEFEREYIIPEGNRRFRYDFRVGRKLIEVQGTRTHADPRVFMAEDVIDTGLRNWKRCKAKTLWAKDEEKKEYAESFGYKVEYIWEMDL